MISKDDYCSAPLVTTQIGIRAIEAANLMYLNNMKRLVLTDPLSQDNNPVAIVTARDLVEAFQKKRTACQKMMSQQQEQGSKLIMPFAGLKHVILPEARTKKRLNEHTPRVEQVSDIFETG